MQRACQQFSRFVSSGESFFTYPLVLGAWDDLSWHSRFPLLVDQTNTTQWGLFHQDVHLTLKGWWAQQQQQKKQDPAHPSKYNIYLSFPLFLLSLSMLRFCSSLGGDATRLGMATTLCKCAGPFWVAPGRSATVSTLTNPLGVRLYKCSRSPERGLRVASQRHSGPTAEKEEVWFDANTCATANHSCLCVLCSELLHR